VFNPDNDITLFSILPDTAALCDMNSPELTPYFMSQQSMFCQLEDRKKQLIDEALVRAKDVLIASGFSDDRISQKIQKKKNGVARDIVDEAKKGYQIIVMGRRGLSGVQEFLMGSVSQKVIHAVKDVSIVIVN
jgi:nucleotide-binding universal stress UspA family protein